MKDMKKGGEFDINAEIDRVDYEHLGAKGKRNLEEVNVVWLSEVNKKDGNIAGGKGANLGEMYNSGMPVPPAFVVTAQAFANLLKETNIGNKIYSILKTIDYENTQQLEDKTRQIREIIVGARMPDNIENDIIEAYDNLNIDKETLDNASKDVVGVLSAAKEPVVVAVRSSATTEDLITASFAGQQDTFLNIKGNQNLLEAVKKCWASLFTARATYYRKRKGFEHEKSLIAVIVQKMINSDKSGVTFTINPINNNKNEIVIEAVYGLGEGIVSGTIEPDNYIIDKGKLKLKNQKIGKKNIYFTKSEEGKTVQLKTPEDKVTEQVLEWHELEKLAYYAKKLEEHYKWPQDIEWAIEKNNIFIVQTRPVTTAEKKETKQEKIKGTFILKGFAASPGVASGTVRVIHSLNELDKIQKGDVLVTKMTNPDMVVTMQKATAIVTDEGGLTCHAAIVSREIGVPAIVGTRKATEVLKEGQTITVDGTNGKIYLGEQKISQISAEQAKSKERIIIESKEDKESKPIISFVGHELKKAWRELKTLERKVKKHKILVKVNCDIPVMAEKAAATGADGVGLVRLEFMIAQNKIHPSEYIREGKADEYTKILVEGLEKIAKVFPGKPIWVRTSDLRTDEYTSLKGAEREPKESNPMLGWHGIRRGLDEPEILKAEFKAIKILHDRGHKNVGVMLPFLIYINELKKAKELMSQVGLNPKETILGVMIETPASVGIIKELCEEKIDFISFGTNDLTQLTLGIDRNNENLAPLYDEMHPAMLRQIEHVIDVCKHYDVMTSICGQAASNENMAMFLADKGIDSISANIDAVDKIRQVVKKFE
jgi:pyruvate,water dikinase